MGELEYGLVSHFLPSKQASKQASKQGPGILGKFVAVAVAVAVVAVAVAGLRMGRCVLRNRSSLAHLRASPVDPDPKLWKVLAR